MFSWADLATPDAEGSKAFYTEILGLTATDLPMQPGMVYSMLAKDGSNVCAIYQMPEEMGQMTGGQPVWNSYFTVESADETASRVAELGGAVMMGPVDVFDSGRMVVSSDPTGAVFSAWEPKSHTLAPRSSASRAPWPGTSCPRTTRRRPRSSTAACSAGRLTPPPAQTAASTRSSGSTACRQPA